LGEYKLEVNHEKRDFIIEKVKDYYLNSGDFNGLPLSMFEGDFHEEVCSLIEEKIIEIYSSRYELNPHIKRLPQKLSANQQKEEVLKNCNQVVLYPTQEYMKGINVYEERPFTKMLSDGRAQLEIVYFKPEVLEMYYQDPRYLIMSHDYRGNIVARDDFFEELEHEYLKDFGIAYHKELGNEDRVIGVFIGDLSELSLKAQLKWKIHFLDQQENYLINYGFYKNTILNRWVDEVSIYDAIIDEMNVINTMCEKMDIPKLFKKTIEPFSNDKPEDYRMILLPTLRNYYSFIVSLEKLLIHSINVKTFTNKSQYIDPIERNNNDGQPKGSLVMLDEWLNKNIRTPKNINDIIITPLRKIRKIRQVPAHEMYSNEFDKKLYKKQNDIIVEVYKSIRAIRLLFSNHPSCKNIEIRDYLITGEKIVVY
jgi:hypothetical protein